MPSLIDIAHRPHFRALVQGSANEAGICDLLDYLKQKMENHLTGVLEPSGGDFEKGQYLAMRDLHNDIKNMMSDTETETGR